MSKSRRSSQTPWYKDGLKFNCTRCGDCCTGGPGYVWVSDEEIAKLADHLNLSTQDFLKKYVRLVGDRLSLIEKPNYECIFWSSTQGCTVYNARPIQCQTWPFWPENIKTKLDWERTCQFCPGSASGQQWFSVEEIEAAARRTHT